MGCSDLMAERAKTGRSVSPAETTSLPSVSTTATAARWRLSTWLPRVTSTSSGFAASTAAALGELSVSMLRGSLRKGSEEHKSELQSLMRIQYAVFCLQKKKTS